jgi:isocitrate lyase
MLISFNKKIYSKQAVQKAIKDYADLADFLFAQNKKYFLVKTKNIQPRIKNVFPDEFSNYVLSLIK